MCKFNLQEMRINDINDLCRQYSDIKKLLSSQGDLTNEQREWKNLIDIIRRSLLVEETKGLFDFPFTIFKQESPDFKIEFLNEGSPLLIEIVRAITPIEAGVLHHFRESAEDCIIDLGPGLFSLDEPAKGEWKRYIKKPGEKLNEPPVFGDGYVVAWLNVVIKAIDNKKKMEYANRTDLLIIDDQSVPLATGQNLVKRFIMMKQAIDLEPDLFNFAAFPNIFTNSRSSLGIIRLDGNWICETKLIDKR